MEFILNLSCPDKAGLVRTVSNWLYDKKCNIIDSDQFGDPKSRNFFMRVHFQGGGDDPSFEKRLKKSFSDISTKHRMSWGLWPISEKPKVMIMVSKQDHCLVDLLYRTKNGELPIEIALVVSNHNDAYPIVTAEGIDFLHMSLDDKPKMEQELLSEVERRNIDFVVLARYMQILGPAVCSRLPGRIINIHHSFLPGFKGTTPPPSI